jgi:ADP-dependent NAD(P)H-hydrate dehydratase / NAD(P)H-hydrate epimerase
MLKIMSVARVREIEQTCGVPIDELIQRAGRVVAYRANQWLQAQTWPAQQPPRVTLLIGPGSNGGDGLVAGRLLLTEFQDARPQVRFYLLNRRDDALMQAVNDTGAFVAVAEDDQQHRVLRNMIASSDLVIDALFGIGARLPIREEAGKVLRNVNQALHARADEVLHNPILRAVAHIHRAPDARAPYVIAVDCPSGVDCESGELDSNAIHADETITFIGVKAGLVTFPAAEAVGDLSVSLLGLDEDGPLYRPEKRALLEVEAARAWLPKRPLDGHKGTFGKALIVAGSTNYVGAAGLAAMAAYRGGTGLVTVGAPQPVAAMLAAQHSEPTWLMLPHDMGVLSDKAAKLVRAEYSKYDALLLGPGWGREDTTGALLRALLVSSNDPSRKRTIGFIGGMAAAVTEPADDATVPPLVIDADGLYHLSQQADWATLLPPDTILTPHEGEMARLMGVDTFSGERISIAQTQAAAWGVVLVLKGAHTVIASSDGRVVVSPFKNAALAKAGTGDVLAGLIAGLRAQGVKAFEAAALSVYLHGAAAQHIRAGHGHDRALLASDIVAALAHVGGLI